jgi:putative chitinase
MRAEEFAIVEKKRRKRRPRWAAYGPGPYGGYGYFAGYSGDGGDGGGVGEASYEGNIGMMEVAKFFKIANTAQKKLLKELLEKGKRGLAWKLIQDVTDTKLKGREYEVDEGWRDTLAGLALGAGVAMSGAADAKVNVERVAVNKGDTVYSIAKAFDTTPDIIKKLNKLDRNFTIKPGDTLKVPAGEIIDEPPKEKKPEAKKSNNKEIAISKADLEDSITGRPLEVYFRKFLESQGIKGEELTAIMAQSDVETDHFKTLKEYGGKNYFKMYEPVFRKNKKTGKIIIDPETKKFKHFNDLADRLGNDYRGDGARYKGRGFLQVTGRYNYRVIGHDIGVDLVKNPEILEKDKEIAAKASLAYWKRFSKPKIKNFKDVKGVTGTINPGLKHLEKRKERHKEYKVAMQ